MIERPIGRCMDCRRWWSVEIPDGSFRCPCGGPTGGEMELVDMQAHMASLPQGAAPPDELARAAAEAAKKAKP